MLHLICDGLHMTCDAQHMTGGVIGIFSQTGKFLAITVWEGRREAPTTPVEGCASFRLVKNVSERESFIQHGQESFIKHDNNNDGETKYTCPDN